MVFQVFFLLSLGSIYTFSSWANLFIGTRSNPGLGLPARLGPFPNWRLSDLDFLYSWGILGAFSMPVGGYLHDRFGAMTTFVLGLALGWLTLRTRSIWPAIMVHALHNLIAVRGEPLLASMDLQGQLLALVGGLLLGGAALFGATRR
jgi:hypothetical protein